MLEDGRILLPNQWVLDPEGEPVALGDFPAAAALSPDGRLLAVVNCGVGKHEVMRLVAEGHLHPVVHAVLPLAEARRGHELLEHGDVFGKLVVTP